MTSLPKNYAVPVEIRMFGSFVFRDKWKKDGKENLGFESSKLHNIKYLQRYRKDQLFFQLTACVVKNWH